MDKQKMHDLLSSVTPNEPEQFRLTDTLVVDYIPDDIATYEELEGGGDTSSETFRYSFSSLEDDMTGERFFISSYSPDNVSHLVKDIEREMTAQALAKEDDDLDDLDDLYLEDA